MILRNFEHLVKDSFGHLCTEFGLQLQKVTDDEIALYGKGFALLAQMAPDGFSMKYINFRNLNTEELDIGGYLLRTGKLVKPRQIEFGADYAADAKRGLVLFAESLGRNGRDILSGETSWMKQVAGLFMGVSEIRAKKIRQVLPERTIALTRPIPFAEKQLRDPEEGQSITGP